MKKIIKKICLFIGKILRFIDRVIITPIMKLFLKISELFSKNNKTFEKLFANKQSLIVISLLLAFLVFYFVDQNSSALVDNSAEILYSQPVTAIYNEEAYVVEGLPETVDVVLIGRQSDIYLAKQYPSQEISVDLRELSAGTHKVSLKYRQAISSVDYKIDPSQVTVIIYDKVSSTREVTAEVLHRNNLDSKLDINGISLSQTEVTIKGSAKKLETVAYVKALIDVDNLVEPTVGEASINNNKLVHVNDSISIELVYPSYKVYSYLKQFEKSTSEYIFRLYSKCIYAVYTGDDATTEFTDDEIYNWIMTLPSTVIKDFESFISAMPTLSVKYDVVCDKCGYKETVEIKNILSFFTQPSQEKI